MAQIIPCAEQGVKLSLAGRGNQRGQGRMALSFGLSADGEPGPGGGVLRSRPVGVDRVGLAALGYEMFGPPW